MQSQAEVNDSSGSDEEIQIQKSTQISSQKEYEDVGKAAWETMAEPSTVKVGHYMMLRCGHNGNLLKEEMITYN